MNRFGKTLQWAFPRFMERMLYLHKLDLEFHQRKRVYGLCWMSNNSEEDLYEIEKCNAKAKEFNKKKYWWIRKIKYIEKRTYITQGKTGDST